MSRDAELLREAVDHLQAAYDRMRAELSDLAAERGLTPEDMRDPNGRSILLDALVSIVNGRTALVLAEAVGGWEA